MLKRVINWVKSFSNVLLNGAEKAVNINMGQAHYTYTRNRLIKAFGIDQLAAIDFQVLNTASYQPKVDSIERAIGIKVYGYATVPSHEIYMAMRNMMFKHANYSEWQAALAGAWSKAEKFFDLVAKAKSKGTDWGYTNRLRPEWAFKQQQFFRLFNFTYALGTSQRYLQGIPLNELSASKYTRKNAVVTLPKGAIDGATGIKRALEHEGAELDTSAIHYFNQ